jgi:hypothetical protein
MPTPSTSELPKPKSWDEFEDIVGDLYSREWRDRDAQHYGRSGQHQQGVDICGRPSPLGGQYAGIQCKRYDAGNLNRKTVEAEITKAEKFKPPLAEYVIATTEPRDALLQEIVRLIDQERRARGDFSVRIVFWDDLCSQLAHPDNDDLLRKHYGDWLARGFRLVPIYSPPPLPGADTLPDPGPLPPGSGLPLPRNAVFTGRRGDLLALAGRLLYPNGAEAAAPLIACGIGGVGKTQLAVEFCNRYGRYLAGIHWLNAAVDPAPEVAACGEAMGIAPWPDAEREQVAATLRAWAADPRRLVVLDNAEDPALLQEWLPRLGGVRALATARLEEWPADLGLMVYPVGLLPRSESLARLRKLAPRRGGRTWKRLRPRRNGPGWRRWGPCGTTSAITCGR